MKKHGPVYVISYTTCVAFLFGLVLSGFAQFTKERIVANKDAKVKKQIMIALGFEVPEEADSKDVLKQFSDFVVEKAHGKTDETPGYIVWEGYSAAGQKDGSGGHNGDVTGYAFNIGGGGFWAPILGIMAVEPDLVTIKGITFYADEETPGLGHEINKPFFRDAFKGKTYRDETGAIGFVFSTNKKKKQNEVDTITGATETVKSVQGFLKKNLQDFVDAVKKYDIGNGGAPTTPGGRASE